MAGDNTPQQQHHLQQPNSRLSTHLSGSLSAELERDFLREKIEHFKVFIKKLQDELHSQRIRKEGAETVSKLLQESKQQTQVLQKKVKSLETVIRNLQSRLEQNGLSSDVTLHEGEEYFQGTSKNLLDNLTRENARLRNILRNQNGDPEELVRVQKMLEDATKDNSALQTRVASLEQVLKASDNDKDRTINQLSEQMAGMELELETRRMECSELDGEKRKLESQLRMVAQQCHELAQKLHSESTAAAGNRSSDTEGPDKVYGPSDEVEKLKEENAKLNKSVLEILKMNRNWQQYNSQREEYVRQLQAELTELRGVGRDHSNNARDLEVQMNKVLDEARKSVSKAHRERDQLRHQLETSEGQVRTLLQQVDQLRRQSSGPSGRGDQSEVIEALKAQVQICTEDFESERKDREKAQNKVVRLEGELSQLRKECESLKRERQQQYFGSSGQPFVSPSSPNLQASQFNPYFYGQYNDGYSELAARGSRSTFDMVKNTPAQSGMAVEGGNSPTVCTNVVKDVVMSAKEGDKGDRDEYLSLRTSSISSCAKESVSSISSHGSRSASPSHDTQTRDALRDTSRDSVPTSSCEVLQCPRCNKQFPKSEQLLLMEHMEECCD